MRKPLAYALLATSLGLPACTIGNSRAFDHKQDLSGLDLTYIKSRVQETFSNNTQSIDGRLNGWPFWFLPAVTLQARGANAQHRAEVEPHEPNEPAVSAISGYDHADLYALGLGLLLYRSATARWDADGGLDRWQEDFGLGWGLVYKESVWGYDARSTGLSTEILAGALGYTEDQGRGYLKLLWIPIPVRW